MKWKSEITQKHLMVFTGQTAFIECETVLTFRVKIFLSNITVWYIIGINFSPLLCKCCYAIQLSVPC